MVFFFFYPLDCSTRNPLKEVKPLESDAMQGTIDLKSYFSAGKTFFALLIDIPSNSCSVIDLTLFSVRGVRCLASFPLRVCVVYSLALTRTVPKNIHRFFFNVMKLTLIEYRELINNRC